MKRMYQLKNLAFVGASVLVVLTALSVLSVCIPSFRASVPKQQLYTIRHQELRDNNPLFTDLFLQSIQKNNGYLILGSSESDYLPTGNYTDFLNADTTLPFFSVMAGAGKTSACYFPLFLSNDNVENLKVLYFVNPAFWCNKKAHSGDIYFHRYTSYTCYRRANRPKDEKLTQLFKINLRNARPDERIGDFFEYYTDRIRRKYYQDLANHLDSTKFYSKLIWIVPKNQFGSHIGHDIIDSAQHDFQFNMSKSFDRSLYRLSVDTNATYRYEELRATIAVCKARHIDITFIVGPYNQIAMQNSTPDEVQRFERVCHNIRQILDQENMPYIDATDLSGMQGTFSDWQHHSSYGAYLIYKKIREYVLEKENL